MPVYGGEAIYKDARVVGRLRSCAYGFTAEKNLAYAYLPAEVGLGEALEVEVFGERARATVAPHAVVASVKA